MEIKKLQDGVAWHAHKLASIEVLARAPGAAAAKELLGVGERSGEEGNRRWSRAR